MKVYRLTCLTALCVLVFIGLISIPFMPTIEAALALPARQQAGMASVASPAPTRVLSKTMAVATRTIIPVQSNVLAWDTFQRGDHMFWGTAPDGQMWGGEANSNPDFAIANRSGRIIDGRGIYNATLGPRITDAEVIFSGSLSSFLHTNLGAVLRWNDGNNWYKAYIDGMQLILARDVAGTITTLGAVPFPANANTSYTLRFRIQGTQLLARVWPMGDTEPQIWMVKATDSAISAGFGGLRLFVQNGVEATIMAFSESAVAAAQ